MRVDDSRHKTHQQPPVKKLLHCWPPCFKPGSVWDKQMSNSSSEKEKNLGCLLHRNGSSKRQNVKKIDDYSVAWSTPCPLGRAVGRQGHFLKQVHGEAAMAICYGHGERGAVTEKRLFFMCRKACVRAFSEPANGRNRFLWQQSCAIQDKAGKQRKGCTVIVSSTHLLHGFPELLFPTLLR